MPQLVEFPVACPPPPLPVAPFPIPDVSASTERRTTSLWHGPGAEGSLGGVTQSMLQGYLCCKERFRVKYVLGLRPLDRWDKSSGYGSMWHKCEEAHAANKDWLEPLRMYLGEQLNKYPMQREEIHKWYCVCRTQFPVYVDYWSRHPDVLDRQSLMSEQTFDVPYALPSGRTVRLRGKFDSVDLIPSLGGVVKQENKTKGDIDPVSLQRQLKFDLQTMTYRVALDGVKDSLGKKLLADMTHAEQALYGSVIVGTRYNVVLRKVTIKPHEAKVKKGKTYKTKPSTPDTVTPAETDAEFYERLRCDYYAAKPEEYFFRLLCRVSQRDVEVFRRQCLDPVLDNLADDFAWWDWCLRKGADHWDAELRSNVFPAHQARHFRFPFGVYNSLVEGGYTDYDNFLDGKGEAGLKRADTLFQELQEQSCL